MILSGKQIKKIIGKEILIEPFSESKIGPNSYNLTLHNELLVYNNDDILDMKKKNKVRKITIPQTGLILQPGKLYLGRTVERTFTDKYVPMIEGRSSMGRLGLFVHITAGFGDIGFNGTWTLEMSCIQPIRIYPNIEVCQIYFYTIKGQYDIYKSDKYQNQIDIQASKMYKEFEKQ
jgi:dCTP deaminase